MHCYAIEGIRSTISYEIRIFGLWKYSSKLRPIGIFANPHICLVAYPALETIKEMQVKFEGATVPHARPKPRGR